MIDNACSNLTHSQPSSQRLESLEQLVDTAANLALDMSKQRALFKMEQTQNFFFNDETMEPVGAIAHSQDFAGQPIQGVVFPYVGRWGTEKGSGYEHCVTILKAQVLI
jgi:hypothetical protein